MLLFVGLGNPGKRYEDTPHNAGFRVCERFAERNHLDPAKRKFEGMFTRGRVGNEDVGVLRPETYMNLSGESVARALRYLPAEPSDVVVVFDDMDLPAGKLRLRKAGGHGGHNGVRSVIEQLATQDFPRVRIGVGRPPAGREPTGHLLSRLRDEEQQRFSDAVDRGVGALELIVRDGFEAAMNRYNPLPAFGEEEEEEETEN